MSSIADDDLTSVDPSRWDEFDFGVMIDGGSTGSFVHVYIWSISIILACRASAETSHADVVLPLSTQAKADLSAGSTPVDAAVYEGPVVTKANPRYSSFAADSFKREAVITCFPIADRRHLRVEG